MKDDLAETVADVLRWAPFAPPGYVSVMRLDDGSDLSSIRRTGHVMFFWNGRRASVWIHDGGYLDKCGYLAGRDEAKRMVGGGYARQLREFSQLRTSARGVAHALRDDRMHESLNRLMTEEFATHER